MYSLLACVSFGLTLGITARACRTAGLRLTCMRVPLAAFLLVHDCWQQDWCQAVEYRMGMARKGGPMQGAAASGGECREGWAVGAAGALACVLVALRRLGVGCRIRWGQWSRRGRGWP